MINFRTVAKTLLPVIFVLSVCLVKAETASYEDVQKVARNFMKRSFDRTDSIVEVVKFDTLDITTMKDGFIELWYGENVKLQNKCELLCDTISVPTEYEVTFINNYGQVETYNGIFVKPDSIITANEDNSIDGVISIYPNPTTGIFNVESYQDNIENILVSNITGMKIKEIDKIKATHFAINLFDFPAGCYFVTVKTENSSIVKKIIKK